MKCNDELRAYFRENKRKQRLSKTVQDIPKTSASVSASDKRERERDDFELFWQSYPRKVGKKAALNAWNKATDKPHVDDVIKAVTAQKAGKEWMKEGGQYIPHPTTWLNQGRWNDATGPIETQPEVRKFVC
jgi:hypothetical protein